MFKPTTLFIHEETLSDRLTQQIISRCEGAETRQVGSAREAIDWALAQPDPVSAGKSAILLERFKGPFFKACPGSDGHVCCNYYVLNAVSQCPLDCSYCFLQEYLSDNPIHRIFTNHDALFDQLSEIVDAQPNRFFRVGTGELSDSLVFDHLTDLNPRLVEFFAQRNFGTLEIKTKTDQIAPLLKIDPKGRTVVAWTLTPPPFDASEEKGAVPTAQRLSSASEAARAGYRLAFHFDPMIYHEGWEESYRALVQQLFDSVPPEAVAWISLGSLRATPGLRERIRRRWPDHEIYLDEFVTGRDGKMRYDKFRRIEMYRKMAGWIAQRETPAVVYLCMESRDVWERVFGSMPGHNPKMDAVFSRR